MSLACFSLSLALFDSFSTAQQIVIFVLLLTTARPLRNSLSFLVGLSGAYLACGCGGYLAFARLQAFLARCIPSSASLSNAAYYQTELISGLVMVLIGCWYWRRHRWAPPSASQNLMAARFKGMSGRFACILGAFISVSSFPVAIPYLLALGKYVSAGLSWPAAFANILLYNFGYAAPMLVALGLYLLARRRSDDLNDTLHERSRVLNVRLTTREGRTVDAHPIAVDFPTGLGLVQPLGSLGIAPLPRGKASALDTGDSVTAISHGGRAHALAARVVAKSEFAGYWEYLLDEALFTAPLHPAWSGAALVDARGRLVGIGSLFVQQVIDGEATRGNMFVPVDVLDPVLDELLAHGRRFGPPRPWLGVYLQDEDGRVVVQDVAPNGPAATAGLAPGDQIAAISDQPVVQVAHAWRVLWRQGAAGVEIPVTVVRDGLARRVNVVTADREAMLVKPRLQ